ncbi:MAG: hypothetical protein CG446_2 [Methanosaeta sp. ASO1]|nr:MAG: hypothetical protein CG446_2 [Methanosaeta sp. ASO1]
MPQNAIRAEYLLHQCKKAYIKINFKRFLACLIL